MGVWKFMLRLKSSAKSVVFRVKSKAEIRYTHRDFIQL